MTKAQRATQKVGRPEQVLADRTKFVLPDQRWDIFRRLLDRDARPMPGLAAFLARPSVFDEE